MIAVIFEAIPATGKQEEYMNTAARLKTELSKSEGFISIERYQSMADPQKVLSLSFWKDEESINAWRNSIVHRKAQQKGRESIFADYRLRVAPVTRDYGMNDREQAPADSNSVHRTK